MRSWELEERVDRSSMDMMILPTELEVRSTEHGRLMVSTDKRRYMNDWRTREGLVLTDMLIFKISIWT